MRLEFSIYRYNPDVDDKPRMQDYTLEAEDGRDMMLLDALIRLKEKDPTLAFRRSCREGVCGSDGLNMNGKKRTGLHYARLGAGQRQTENCYPSAPRFTGGA
ncbi:Succinate dehydrogenase iron-sulfur subunit [Pantoea agglomerans]|uniref:Succinate dehydrogenase iron-sulfur subunit n=1 Tax=Enterobacter agglomerans TaxID=549 RepID=A0A379AKN6_ENTAG|nr:Succinate dehydrogenase iron-sulfur subunit [Pantoea agglomerans]